jgi:hypothetical protein
MMMIMITFLLFINCITIKPEITLSRKLREREKCDEKNKSFNFEGGKRIYFLANLK